MALESFFCSETADRQPVPRAWARGGEENRQRWKPCRSKKSLKASKRNTIRPKCRCLESVQVSGLLQSSVVKAQIGLNIFLKWNISDDSVASYQTSLFIPHSKHSLVHKCPFRVPIACIHRCKVPCDLQSWKSTSTTSPPN